MSETAWQPIETATSEHRRILGYQATAGDWEHQMAVCWSVVMPEGALIWFGAGGLMPTHWQPLPTPPTAA